MRSQITAGGAPKPTEGESALLRDLIYRESGIQLGPSKSSLLVARLGRRVRELGLGSFGAYYDRLIGGDEAELTLMLDSITTNETQFFREPHQFRFLEAEVFPEWRRQGDTHARPKQVSAWSAACATGEEVYSLAMSLLWHFPRQEGWSVQVLGSDISTRALEAARGGIWPAERARTIPSRYLRRFMLRGVRAQAGRVRISEELRRAVRLERINLADERAPLPQTFDVVLARNVLIYFAPEMRARTLARLARRVRPGGYLLLGHSEHPGGALPDLETVRPTIYRAPERSPRRST